MLRSLAERFARNCRIRRTLPCGVAIYVSPDAQLKYLKRRFDDDLVALGAAMTAADTVWDIGANCGVLSFSAAAAHRVIALEADPFLADLLAQSAAMNHAPVTVVPAAAWSGRGLAEFAIAARGRASNHLVAAGGHSQTGGVRGTLTVPTLTLDELYAHFGAPTFVKIDVEGAEASVLAGATRLLAEARPRLYLEIVPGDTVIGPILLAAGYRLTPASDMNWFADPLVQAPVSAARGTSSP